ncbi:MAG: helix-turn-helix transcriptional regulator [Clostridia bacterium]|nr:helix-turn-helix transcriptional regulator [Clostridia bacterium]
MIVYDPFFRTLKEKKISTYKLIKEYGVTSSLLDRMKHNKSITTTTLNDLCSILGCGVEGILAYVPDGEPDAAE